MTPVCSKGPHPRVVLCPREGFLSGHWLGCPWGRHRFGLRDGGRGEGRAGVFSLKQSPLERVGGHAQDCLLGEGSVKDWICKWRELRFQFCLRRSSVQGWSRDGGLPSRGGARWLPTPGWACTGRAGPCSPRVPGPHAAIWGAQASVWGGLGLWELVPACQNPVVQEWLWERRLPAAPLAVTPLPVSGCPTHGWCSPALCWHRWHGG